jgi:hypothetical protein
MNSLGYNLLAWSKQRFPLSQGIFIAVLFSTSILYSQYLNHPQVLVMGVEDGLGFFACWAVFLMLRIIDEHKDFAEDLHNYPDRVLQSGRITLDHLKVVGIVSFMLQLGFCLLSDEGFGKVTFAWLLVMGWSLLMAVEFFMPRWLNENQLIYGSSHMLIIVFIVAWLMQVGVGDVDLFKVTDATIWLLLLAFFAGCAYELTRKAWGAEEERDTVTSYTRILGATGVTIAINVSLALAVVMSISMLVTIRPVGSIVVWSIALIAAWLPVAIVVSRYASKQTIKARKTNEAFVGLCLLVIYLTPLIAMLATRGIQWVI